MGVNINEYQWTGNEPELCAFLGIDPSALLTFKGEDNTRVAHVSHQPCFQGDWVVQTVHGIDVVPSKVHDIMEQHRSAGAS